MALSTTKLRSAWKKFECKAEDMIVIPFGPDHIRIAPPTTDAWRALAAVLAHHGYEIRVADTDSYNCRTITGGTGKSLHSYGIALDVNWTTNPFIRTPDKRNVRFSNKPTQDERAIDVKEHRADTDMTAAMINDVLAIKTEAGTGVFEWGGNWNSVKDAMHFEIDLTPDDLAQGIDWETVVGRVEDAGVFVGEPGDTGVTDTAAAGPSARFRDAHRFIARWEGGFVNDPDDPGGATNMGITIATLSRWRDRPVSVSDVRNLSRDEADRIFHAWYWTPLRCEELPPSIALMTYNAGVNSGPSRAARFLQEALNIQGHRLVVDGKIGRKTLAASSVADERLCVESYADIYERFYRGLSTFRKFGRGWLNRLSDIENAALGIVGTPLATEQPQKIPATDHVGVDQMSTTANQPTPQAASSDLAILLTRAVELIQLVQGLRARDSAGATPVSAAASPGEKTDSLAATLKSLAAVVSQLGEKPDDKTAETEITAANPKTDESKDEPPLTPVNAALGETVGKMLNGRKTGIGIVGLLATTLLPILYPPAAPVIAGVQTVLNTGGELTTEAVTNSGGPSALSTIVGAAAPVFTALTGWGVLGKVEKWVAKLNK